MTISSTLRKAGPYIGSGAASTFPFAFKVFTQSDLKVVTLQTSTSTESVLLLTADYSAVINADQNSNPGGSITLLAGPLASGYNLVITSNVEPLQETDLTNQGGFYPEVINDALDKAIIQIQQLTDAVNRSIKVSTTNTITSTEFTEGAAARANKVLGFDSDGEFSVSQELGQFQGDWLSGNSYVQRDIVRDPVNFNVYICMVAHTATGIAPIKDQAQIANWQLLVDAQVAGDYAAAAAASAAAANADRIIADASAALASAAAITSVEAKDLSAASAVEAAASEAVAIAQAVIAANEADAAQISADEAAASAAAAAAAAGGGAVAVSITDTTADYLENKFVAGTDIQLIKLNAGGNEQLSISSPYAVAYAIALGG